MAADVIAALGRGEAIDSRALLFRTLPRFETSTKRYGYLNRIITVGVGEVRPTERSTPSTRSCNDLFLI